MSRALAAAIALLALLPLSGCFGGGSDSFDFVPGTKFKETGNTVHLKATVMDYDSELYEGLDTYLWAFCFEPVNPDDAYSANAIEGWTPLEGDKVIDSQGNERTDLRGKCSVPGPTLRVKQGDKVIVEFSNNHFHPHTIHWHGQFVDWQSDGAPGTNQDSVESAGAFRYEFIAKRAGTLWYHCHVDTQTHVMQGLYGMIIIEPQDKTYEPKGIDREYNIVLSTMNRGMVEAHGARHNHPLGCASGFPDCENPVSDAGKPDVFLLNGHSYPFTMEQAESLIVVKPGERVRLRVLNAGETVETLHPHGHDMQVIAKDGNPLSKSSRYWVDTLTIAPAERYDVVIVADNPGPWMIHTHVASHETNCGKAPGGMHTMLVYEEYLDKMHQFRAELPVDCPKGETLVLPSDFSNFTTMSLSSPADPAGVIPPGTVPGVGPTEVGTWSFPVHLPCAVRSMEFFVTTWQPATAERAAPADIDVMLTNPKGLSNSTSAAPGQPGTFVWKEHTLSYLSDQAGTYTVEVSGTGQDVKVDLNVNVDYYETFEQSKVGHLTYGVPGCPGYT